MAPSTLPGRRPDVTGVELFGGVVKRDLVLIDSDPSWPKAFAQHEDRVCVALGAKAREVEHIGSTSVPGLAAKPIIDILVTVDDITSEEDYLDPLFECWLSVTGARTGAPHGSHTGVGRAHSHPRIR